nr:winged helix-turn-helix domain-containing protein [Streptomyces sp. CC208A]
MLLLERHGRSWQQPARRAVERDDAAVALRQKETWPQARSCGRKDRPLADRIRGRSSGRIPVAGLACPRQEAVQDVSPRPAATGGRKDKPKDIGRARPARPAGQSTHRLGGPIVLVRNNRRTHLPPTPNPYTELEPKREHLTAGRARHPQPRRSRPRPDHPRARRSLKQIRPHPGLVDRVWQEGNRRGSRAGGPRRRTSPSPCHPDGALALADSMSCPADQAPFRKFHKTMCGRFAKGRTAPPEKLGNEKAPPWPPEDTRAREMRFTFRIAVRTSSLRYQPVTATLRRPEPRPRWPPQRPAGRPRYRAGSAARRR